jgi:hypothetical protein
MVLSELLDKLPVIYKLLRNHRNSLEWGDEFVRHRSLPIIHELSLHLHFGYLVVFRSVRKDYNFALLAPPEKWLPVKIQLDLARVVRAFERLTHCYSHLLRCFLLENLNQKVS